MKKKNNYLYEDSDEYYGDEFIHWFKLNDEVEIIEDTPKEENIIPEKLKLYAPYPECEDYRFDIVEAKINEIIEYLENKIKD